VAKTKSVLEARSTLQKNKVFCNGEVFSCHGLLMGDPLYVIPNLENQSIFVTFYYVTTFKELKSGIDYYIGNGKIKVEGSSGR